MKTISKILVAIDFSEHSLDAARYAFKAAADIGASILLVNVFNQRDVNMLQKVELDAPDFSSSQYIEESLADRSARLDKLADELNETHLQVETNVRIGVPYEVLLQIIEDSGSDLLVMGIKGKSNLVNTIIGSCAQKMFRLSPIPLLSLR